MTTWRERCRDRLPEFLDARGDLAPPWAKFPAYERYAIGWRMGAGEDWMMLWSVFLADVPREFESRLAYLRRHAPAPETWAADVYAVLHALDEEEEADMDDEPKAASERLSDLRRLGLVASDVAYPTWLAQQQGVRWPWERGAAPEIAARHSTRELWFWSRQVAALRGTPGWFAPEMPSAWEPCASALRTGEEGVLDPRQGLLALARMLCAGRVRAPWELGCTMDEFSDSFDDDMGLVDAFRLWGMSAFDDAEQLERYLAETACPPSWRTWVTEQLPME